MDERPGFGLYVHWPFCQAKCPYCDFNSHVVSSVDQSRWAKALSSEINRLSSETPLRVLDSIFFGGGTPSLMHPDTVARVIEEARSQWLPSNDMEVTLEANPTSVEAYRFRGYRDAGVNRISMGIQALNDVDLKALGRLHTANEAKAAFEVARSTFERISFDLIYARQNQTLDEWSAELNEAVEMAADHLSLYQLSIEPETAFGDRWARGSLKGLPDDDLSADMFEVTQSITEDAGLLSYETSNHALPEAESKHNLIYWSSGDWAAVGPGAHGRLTLGNTRIATEAFRAPGEWLNSVEKSGSGESLRENLSAKEANEEAVMMGLRLRSGVSSSVLEDLLDESFTNKIKVLEQNGLIIRENDKVATTGKGRPVLNAILRELLA